MEKRLFIVMSVLCVASEAAFIGANAQKAYVINNTNQPTQVGFTLPEQHRADIEITKIKSVQEKLHAAILKDSVEGIRDAVKEGADINVEKNGKSPIMWAILLSRSNALEALLKLGAVPNDECGKHAIKVKSIKALLLLAKHSRINFEIKEVVDFVTTRIFCNRDMQVSIDFIRELIHQGYEVNLFWRSIIFLAKKKPVEGLEMLQFLLFRGANPNHAMRDPRKSQKTILLTPLYLVVAYALNKQVANKLIEAGADVNQKANGSPNENLKPLISCAIEAQNRTYSAERQEVIELLLEHGATL